MNSELVNNRKNWTRLSMRLFVLWLIPGLSLAQSEVQVADRSKNRLIEEVVVTAQKREEKLKDVPISIQAFSQEKMEALGIVSIQDIQLATPGFTVTNAAGFNVTFLRGVGSDAYLPAVDSSVPFYLDGVPLLAIQGTSDTLGRIERVEVLKGPQGTLFGRNATGGSISIVTPEPDQEFYGDIKLEAGNENQENVTAFVNVPVFDSLAFNASVFSNERDNPLTNMSTGNLVPFYAHGGRAKLRYDMTDALSFTLNGTVQETSGNCALAFQNIYPSALIGGQNQSGKDPKFDRQVNLDGDAGCQNESYVWGGNINWVTDYVDAKLILSRQQVKATRVDGPFDGTAAPIADAHGAGKYGARQVAEQDTVELQILSTDDTPLSEYVSWAAGLFYLDAMSGFDPIVFNVSYQILAGILPVPGNLGGTLIDLLGMTGNPYLDDQNRIVLANYGLLYTKSSSAYFQPTFYIGQNWELTTGVRYQSETRELKESRTEYQSALDGSWIELPVEQGAQEKLEPEQWSYRVALQWKPDCAENTQIYASWARGWKSPTYNTVNLLGNTFGTMVPLKAERVDTTELGVKTQLFDGIVNLNAAVFFTDQKDPLSSNVSIPSGGVANFTNAGGAEIKGAETDFLITPMPTLNPGLVLTGAVSYVDAIYTEFTNGRGYDDDTGAGFGNGGLSNPPRDLSGNRMPRVPVWSAQIGFNQRITFGVNHAVEIGADISYASDFYFLPQESDLSKREDLYLSNARVTYMYEPWQLEVAGYINNITDETYVESAFVSDFGTSLLANDNVRLYGVRVKKGF